MGLDASRAVAIVGMGARLPGAENVEKYRGNLRDGVVAIGEVPGDRWESDLYYDPDPGVPDKTYSKIGGFLEPYKPDYRKWRMPPKVAESLDTTQILALSITHAALEDAGYSEKDFDRARCAVIVGNSMGGDLRDYSASRLALAGFLRDLEKNDVFGSLTAESREAIMRDVETKVLSRHPAISEDTMAGELANVVAGRIAAAYKITGPNFTVDAACASSLAAINSAVNVLRSGESDMVITGGVDRNMSVSSFVKFCKTNALSPDRSTPFDEGANGFVMGEGGGILVLKRLEDAWRDGDRIRGVILGCGGSSDGGGRGITAPSPRGQIQALQRAYMDAGVSPATMGYMEAHGTSTKVGDDAEIRTIALLLENAAPQCGFLPIGSSKSMFGHLKSAAGAAGMIRAVLSLENRELYPTMGYEKPNAALREIKPPLRIPTTLEDWEKDSHGPRRACVSAFGFGGTNFHIVMEEASEPPKERVFMGSGGNESKSEATSTIEEGKADMTFVKEQKTVLLRGTGLFRLGAENKDDLVSEVDRTLEVLKKGIDPVSAGELMGRPVHGQKYRLAFVGSNKEELIARLEEAREYLTTGKGSLRLSGKGTFVGSDESSRTAFLFPGQGSQYVGMLKDLLYLDVVRETMREADEVMYPILGRPLSDFMLGNAETVAKGDVSAAEAALKQTMVTQPAVLTADVAILRLMLQLGLKPDMVAGHSLGEYAACVAAGVLEFGDALRVVAARGREMTDAVPKGGDPGLMAVVSGPADVVEAHLSRVSGYVTAANKNSPNQTVIAGNSDAVREAGEIFKQEGLVCRTIPVSHAFHTRVVAAASEPLRRVLERSGVKRPSVDIFSNVTAELYPETTGEIIDLLARQVASPVEFIKIVEKMHERGAGTFVEIGPKRALYGFVKDILAGKPHRAVLTNHPKKGGPRSLAEALSSLVAAGAPLAPTAFGPEETVDYSPPVRTSGSSGGSVGSSENDLSATCCSDVDIWITGAAVGLPGREKVFSDDNMEELLDGKVFLSELDAVTRGKIAENRIVRIVKSEDGTGELRPIESGDDVMTWAGRGGKLDLQEEYLVPADWDKDKDPSTRLAVGAAFEAMRDAWLPLVEVRREVSNGKSLSLGWRLPEKAGEETGVIFASAFAGHTRMLKMVEEMQEGKPFPRSALLQMLAIGHAHVAELFGAYGPNLQINTACASTTTALSIAQDWIRLGRCRRVLIIAGDDVTSDELMPWVGGGFLAVGAATTERSLDKAAIPFGAKRNGLILGMGAVGLVVESADSARERGVRPLAELVGSLIANSGSHPMRLRPDHIALKMSELVGGVCKRLGMSREELARNVVFMSHETYTPARGGSAQAEADALRKAFGEHVHHVKIVNTKGFTGHTMAVGLEDGLLPAGLYAEKMPRVANLNEPDPEFADLSFHEGGTLKRRFAIRLAAGFGSQLAMSILKRGEGSGLRVEENTFRKNAEDVYDIRNGSLVLDRRTLRARSEYRSADEALPDALTEALAKEETASVNVVATAEETVEPERAEKIEEPASEVSLGVSTARVVTSEEVLKRLMEVVSEKTGYDIEELEGDLELEADLGVDTVKQAEIMAKVREEYGMARDENFRLSDYPTLEAMAEYVASNLAPAKSLEHVERFQNSESLKAEFSKAWDLGDGFQIRRVSWDGSVTRSGGGGTGEKSPFSFESTQWIVVAPESLRDGLNDFMTGLTGVSGLDHVFYVWEDLASMDEKTMIRKLEKLDRSGRWSVLCFAPEEMKEAPVSNVYGAFRLARLSASHFAIGNEPNTGFWLSLLSGPEGNIPQGAFAGALAGLTRSLGHEWPSCNAFEIPDNGDLKDMKLRGAHVREMVLRRLNGEPVQNLKKYEGAEPFNLDPDGVVLITGALGGLGDLTARLIKRMWNCRIVLVDLAKRPGKSSDCVVPGRKELRERLEKGGKRVTPRVLDGETDRLERELAAAKLLEDLEVEPGKMLYFSADLRKEKDIDSFMREVKSRWGRLDMVIHGAGVEISRPLAGKSDDEIRLTIGAKTEAAQVIYESAREVFGAPVKRFIGYGSVAGVLGNPGQTDYSAANAGLGGFASYINAKEAAGSALIIHWTGWDGLGMTRFAWIRDSLKTRGLDLLPRDKGVEAMSRLFSSVARGEVLVSGRLGELEPEKDDHAVFEKKNERAENESGEVESVLTLDVTEEWLAHHSVDGTPVLPGVAGTEFMAHAAKKLARDSVELMELQNLEFHKALRLSANRRTEARARSWWIDEGVRAQAVLESITHGKKGPIVRKHFTAEFVFEPRSAGSDVESRRETLKYDPLDIGILNGSGPGRNNIYEQFFHGPSYQVLNEVKLAGNRGLTAYAGDRALVLPWVEDGSQIVAPLALEAAFQAAGFHCLMFDGASVLPVGAAKVKWVDPSMILNGSPWVVRVVRVESSEHDSNVQDGVQPYRFNAHVLDYEGRLLMAVWGLQMARREMVNVSRTSFVRPVMEVIEMPLSALGGEKSMVVDPAEEMSQGEMRELARIENAARRMEWIAGRLAAKELVRRHLRDHYGKAVFRRDIEIATQAGGAPMPWIPSRPEMGACLPSLSITHACGRAIVLGLPSSEPRCRVGVDLVSATPRDESFVRQWMSDREQALINRFGASDGKAFLTRDESIAVIWGLKEAVSKALGLGLHLTSAEMEIKELLENGRASAVLTGEALRRYEYLRGGALNSGWKISDGVVTAWAVLELKVDGSDGVDVEGESSDFSKHLPLSSYKL